MMDKGKLASIRRIIKSLENTIAVVEDKFQSNGHDDNEALLVILHKALDTARNVARSCGERD